MNNLAARKSLMQSVLRKVTLAGLTPLLWHLDVAGLQAFRDDDGSAPNVLNLGPRQMFMDVPIDPVARADDRWRLDVGYGLSLFGRWSEADRSAPFAWFPVAVGREHSLH